MIYEYRCPQCEAECEVEKKISDESDELCATCGAIMSRQISVASFVLKGDGWFKDGYNKKN